MDHEIEVRRLRGIRTGTEPIAVGTNCQRKVAEDRKIPGANKINALQKLILFGTDIEKDLQKLLYYLNTKELVMF